MTILVSERVRHATGTPVYLHYSPESAAAHATPAGRFLHSPIAADTFHVLRDPRNNELRVHAPEELTESALSLHQHVATFKRNGDGWTVVSGAPLQVNGELRNARKGVLLEPGAFVSILPHSDRSHAFHAQVPMEGQKAPLASTQLVPLLMRSGVEPIRYRNAIAVLGAKIDADGKPAIAKNSKGEPLLEESGRPYSALGVRVEKAVREFIDSWKRGVPTALIFSGGHPYYLEKEHGPEVARKAGFEAVAMRNYALKVIQDEGLHKDLPNLTDHIFTEDRSRDAIGNFYFIRRMIESPEHQAKFTQLHSIRYMLEKPFVNRFELLADHVFEGTGISSTFSSHPTFSKAEFMVGEAQKVFDRPFMDETRPGNLDSMGTWLQTPGKHALYEGLDSDFFRMTGPAPKTPGTHSETPSRPPRAERPSGTARSASAASARDRPAQSPGGKTLKPTFLSPTLPEGPPKDHLSDLAKMIRNKKWPTR